MPLYSVDYDIENSTLQTASVCRYSLSELVLVGVVLPLHAISFRFCVLPYDLHLARAPV